MPGFLVGPSCIGLGLLGLFMCSASRAGAMPIFLCLLLVAAGVGSLWSAVSMKKRLDASSEYLARADN